MYTQMRSGQLCRRVLHSDTPREDRLVWLNKANTSDTEASFLYLHLFISNDIFSTKIYDKRDDLILKLLISLF